MSVLQFSYTELSSSGFFELPSKLYPAEFLSMVPNKVSPDFFYRAYLIPNKGRLVVYHNSELKYEGEKAICVGHFECEDNKETANLLLNCAMNNAKKLDAPWLIGPMNGSTWDNYRFNLNRDSAPYFLEPYHHLYYNQLWTGFGFEPIANYYSSVDSSMQLFQPDRMVQWQQLLDKKGVIIRSIDIDSFETEIGKLHSFCEEVFQHNFLYTPISKQSFVEKYIPIKPFVDRDFVLLAEDVGKEVVGVFFAVKDLYNQTEQTLIVKTIARSPKREYAGLMHIMGNTAVAAAKKKGFTRMIHAFMHHDNKSNNVSGKFSGEVFRNYALYGKQIS